MNQRREKGEVSRYLQVYAYYKELILSGQMKPGTKLPSIRKGSVQFQVSRTTMESAYLLLAAEGYLISKPQSGYYVTDMGEKQRQRNHLPSVQKSKEKKKIRYDFVTSNVDRESFRFELWRRYMKSALRQDERLLSYGEPQGEWDFREVLCDYLRRERSVVATPEHIVIGAGVQSLLQILCPLIADRKRVAFYNPEYVQGRAVFEDYGYEIMAGDSIREEMGGAPGVYYISPSQMTRWGGVMPIRDRLNFLERAGRENFLIIEDDYNSEFRYDQKPTPSLQGMSAGKGVVYLGTFSKMLLPSIRMSYMVLPAELLEEYEHRRKMYNQTASKAEQIAITQFIRDGHLSSQIRKSRKIHLAKGAELCRVLEQVLGDRGRAQLGESGFHVYVNLDTPYTAAQVAERAEKKGMAVLPVPETVRMGEGGREGLELPFSGEKGALLLLGSANVAVEEYQAAAQLLKECI